MANDFPVGSTTTITPTITRLIAVLRRSSVADVIQRGGVFTCRQTLGSDLWSAHAFGDAVDLFPTTPSRVLARRIGEAIVAHATRPTLANRGRPCRGVVFVIAGDRQWIRGRGWLDYDGVPHDGHVHAAGSFSTRKRPPCASG